MDNLTEIREELDLIYKEYKDNKSQLNSEKTKTAAKLIVRITLSEDIGLEYVALELARFSADVVNAYFNTLIKSESVSLDVIDEVLKELYATDKNAKLSQYYVQKYAVAITSIMKNYKDEALKSVQLPVLVAFIARFAVQSKKYKEKFQKLINNTSGGIYMLDYTGINRRGLTNIWNCTKAVFPDLSQSKYESFITEWAKKYGFIKADKESPVNGSSVKNEKDIAPNKKSAEMSKQVKMPRASTDRNVPPAGLSSEVSAEQLYVSLKSDMTNTQEAIITAFSDMITPISKAFEIVQGEINKSREMGSQIVSLRSKLADLESQLSEQRTRLQTAEQSLMSVRSENDELKNQIASLESRNSELDSKLLDAYAVNSRESSLEAERIRSNLKKEFKYLYEDWLEYEFSDVSEENYESLQAIIKKTFRSLNKNGIDFKGNN